MTDLALWYALHAGGWLSRRRARLAPTHLPGREQDPGDTGARPRRAATELPCAAHAYRIAMSQSRHDSCQCPASRAG